MYGEGIYNKLRKEKTQRQEMLGFFFVRDEGLEPPTFAV
jgi:hypothetical protein